MEVSHKVSYTSAEQSSPLIGLTTHQLLEKRVHEHPDREMYVFVEDNERITFKEFKDQVERLAAGLLFIGLEKGDRLAVWCRIHMEFLLFVAAARSIGVVTVRIRPTFTNSAVKDILLRTGCKVLVLGRSPTDLYDRMKEITVTDADSGTRIPQLDAVIGVGETNKIGTYSIDDIENLGSDPKFTELFKLRKNEVKFDDDSDIFCTSGSTGTPKLVVHSHFSVINGSKAYLSYIDDMPDKENGRILARNSNHSAGDVCGVMPPLVVGITSVYASSIHDIKCTVQAIQNERCTDTFFLIHHLYDILNSKDIGEYDISSLRVCHVGGSTIPSKLMQEFESKNGTKVMSLYGSTEMMLITSSMPWDPVEARFSAGKPLSNTELQVVDDDGRCVPVGSVGEVWCRSAGAFQRYFEDEETTRVNITPHRWYKTGDLGILDESGVLSVVGRKKDLIVKGGENIIPAPIENILSQHPSINQVQVIGVPDERLGEEVCVCIRPEKDMHIDKDEIVAYLTGKVRDDNVPGHLLIFDSFPTSDIGKIDRINLIKQAIQRLESEQATSVKNKFS